MPVTSEGRRDHRRSRQQRQEREKSKAEGPFMYYVPRRDSPSAQHRKRGEEWHFARYQELKWILDSRSQLQISQPYPSQRAERTMLQRAIDFVPPS